jgi:hypothetical protein
MLAMVLLCVGVFLSSWTRMANAADYTVTVRVPGPAPTVAATIDSPITGTAYTANDIPITVKGTCPTDTYVSLLRNNVFSGVSICASDGTWEVSTSLYPGNNQLIGRVYSFTDVPGPDSNEVVVSYTPPTPPPTPPATTDGGSSTPTPVISNGNYTGTPDNPIIIKTEYSFRGYYVRKTATVSFDIEGGVPPYAVSVDWGDNKQDLLSREKSGVVTMQHVYDSAGGYKGNYLVKIWVTDAAHNKSFLQTMVIINNPPVVGSGVTSDGSGLSASFSGQNLSRLAHYIWPSYGLVVLMLFSFWLGERREYRTLQPHLKKTRRV